MVRDKTFLNSLTKEVRAELRYRHIGSLFRIKQKTKLRKTNTDGWRISIGIFKEYECKAEIWLDRFVSHTDRKIYYGLYAYKKYGFAKLVQAAAKELGKHLSLGAKDWSTDTNYYHLERKFAKHKFGHPIYEKYPDHDEFFYGIYEYDKTGLQKNVLKRLTERVVNFFQTVAEAISGNIDLQRDYNSYHAVEDRKAVDRHMRRERNSHVVTLCKQRDNYICKICAFDFSKAYGIIGKDFTEAHHIVPLATNNKRRITTTDDLITVCSNCHRMLHRMKGESGDIKALKRIVAKRA